jgi:hypothetical protein
MPPNAMHLVLFVDGEAQPAPRPEPQPEPQPAQYPALARAGQWNGEPASEH